MNYRLDFVSTKIRLTGFSYNVIVHLLFLIYFLAIKDLITAIQLICKSFSNKIERLKDSTKSDCLPFCLNQASLTARLAEQEEQMEKWRKERDSLVSALEVQLKKLISSIAEKDKRIQELQCSHTLQTPEVSAVKHIYHDASISQCSLSASQLIQFLAV